MANAANEYPDFMQCPLIDEIIHVDDCLENQAVANHEIIESSLPERFRKEDNWRDICLQCKYFDE